MIHTIFKLKYNIIFSCICQNIVNHKQYNISSLLMGKKKFNKKESVRFMLTPGIGPDGEPTVLYKPVENKTSRLSKKQQSKVINELADMQIEINGKSVNQSEIPLFVLEQIKNRSDLIFNQKNGMTEEMEDEGEIYEEQFIEGDENEWDEQFIDDFQEQQVIENQEQAILGKQQQQQEIKVVEIDGKTYNLTAKQAQLLETVLPQDYEKYTIQGVQFVKYDEDGNRLDQKQSYAKYIADPNEKRAIICSYDYVPPKMKDTYDNDLKEEQIKGDMKEIEQALEYEGPEEIYQQLEDDFFANLLKNQAKPKAKPAEKKISESDPFKKKKSAPIVVAKVQEKKPVVEQKYTSKYDQLDEDNSDDYQDIDEEEYQDKNLEQLEGDQITDQMLDRAIEEFDHKFSSKQQQEKKRLEDEANGIYKKPEGISLIEYLESKEQFRGKDGELDWRILTKKEKRQFMKTKKIKQFYDEVREREIQQKMMNKKNVTAEQLHLKQYVKHIPYNEDHVIHNALERDAAQVVNLSGSDEDYETESSQDDIVSYRAKTSIISQNLAVVEEESKKSKKKKNDSQEGSQTSQVSQRVKVIPEKRNKNQTKQQRKSRKDKLKQMKKLKKQQRKQFGELFEKQRKKAIKNQKQSSHNVLHKVAYVKMV